MRTNLFIAAVAFALSVICPAFGGDSDKFTDANGVIWTIGYTDNGHAAQIYSVDASTANSSSVDVPGTITAGDQYTVDEIYNYAFEGCTKIKTVNLPESITTLSGWAFANMNGEVTVYAPDTLKGKLFPGPTMYGTTGLTVKFYSKLPDISLDYPNFTKSQTVRGAMREKSSGMKYNGAVVELKFAKASKAKGGQPRTVKLTATFTGVLGDKQRAKATLKLNSDGSTVSPVYISLKLNGTSADNLTLKIADGKVSLEGSIYKFAGGKIGGLIPHSSLNFFADVDTAPNFGSGWGLLELDGYPVVPNYPYYPKVTVQNGRRLVTTSKVSTIKLKKGKGGWVTFTGIDAQNICAVKLSYTMKTGQFKGTFKMYALNSTGTKLKCYSVKVSGYFIEGQGLGVATLKKPKGGPWVVSIQTGVG